MGPPQSPRDPRPSLPLIPPAPTCPAGGPHLARVQSRWQSPGLGGPFSFHCLALLLALVPRALTLEAVAYLWVSPGLEGA